ncbi:MAG: hypothetical protein E7416_03510 [Ruminococcaceae bacterium]|nr:hypothetical protein [Oscillospiraceae bacterium]
MIYNFTVIGDSLTLDSNFSGNSGSLNYYKCNFTFDGEWDGLTKFAVFTKGDETYTVFLEDNCCTMPCRLLESPATVGVGVYATNLDADNPLRISTNFSHIVIREGAYREGVSPEVPEAELWEIYFKKAAEAAMPYVNAAVEDAIGKINSLNAEAKEAVDKHLIYVEDTLGDIDKAVDAIIEIQNRVIGGESL